MSTPPELCTTSGLDGREGSCRLLFNRFKDALIGRFGANVEVTGEGTPTSTGWFEVEVSGVGLVFSKKSNKVGRHHRRNRKGHEATHPLRIQ
uniref:Selenoprotein w n=1 Tax=Echinococcus granulosus TaxID=6210 RepID=A0A068WDD7_ECHGR|nr:selenoprotein w [Echinococcus granulosus]